MSLSQACKLVVRAAMPKGSVWIPKPGGNLDKIYDVTGDIIDLICKRMLNARFVRNPKKTFLLDDLEREYGIIKNDLLTELERRTRLDAKKNQSPGGGTATDLQAALDNAGFNVLVHKNNPPVDPALFLTQNFQMVAGGDNAFAGFEPISGPPTTAFAGLLGGELLVNGSVFEQSPAITMQAGGAFAFAGNGDAVAGRFDSLNREPIIYEIPTDPEDWPFVFFVGGEATRDPITDELTAIEQGFVPNERRSEFETIILSIKPTYTWAALIITFE